MRPLSSSSRSAAVHPAPGFVDLECGTGVPSEKRQSIVSTKRPEMAVYHGPAIRIAGIRVPRPGLKTLNFLIGVILLVVLTQVHLFVTVEQQGCFAILVAASWLWATEALPLYVTALVVPLLVVLLRVLRDSKGTRLDAHAATRTIFGTMFSPTIMLLLGGFAIASALSKHGIARRLAVSLLARAGTRTVWVLLANMLVATFASMWISNVAAPVLCFSIVHSILMTLPSGDPFGKSLILGIAIASNIGGMASPISSPQNVIAIQTMSPAASWGDWFAVALPVALLGDLVAWGLLLLVFQPHRSTPAVEPLTPVAGSLDAKQWFIVAVTLVTIVLWCVESTIESVVGDMGLIAILPLVVFFGTGLLNKDDFNAFQWTVIMLAMGGIALGQAVNSSGLLATAATGISSAVEGLPQWSVLASFGGLMLVIATFISHTVAALILLPVVNQVGLAMAGGHPRLLVMATVLIGSGAGGLPVSGFPNMNAVAQEDRDGKRWLAAIDFLKVGVPASICVYGIVLSVGYGLCLAIGL
ncbi:low-affinity phosphate transporter [Allomyces arbusculus]|nr:low-affinity phosphate transporter [Allomyces arbusculus]